MAENKLNYNKEELEKIIREVFENNKRKKPEFHIQFFSQEARDEFYKLFQDQFKENPVIFKKNDI